MKTTHDELEIIVQALILWKHYITPSNEELDNWYYNTICSLLDRAIEEVSK